MLFGAFVFAWCCCTGRVKETAKEVPQIKDAADIPAVEVNEKEAMSEADFDEFAAYRQLLAVEEDEFSETDDIDSKDSSEGDDNEDKTTTVDSVSADASLE
eukprot:Platyproteum_vivax@DN231_c0_g1_i1.p1